MPIPQAIPKAKNKLLILFATSISVAINVQKIPTAVKDKSMPPDKKYYQKPNG